MPAHWPYVKINKNANTVLKVAEPPQNFRWQKLRNPNNLGAKSGCLAKQHQSHVKGAFAVAGPLSQGVVVDPPPCQTANSQNNLVLDQRAEGRVWGSI